MLQAEALAVHLFVVTGGEHRDAALAYLRKVWRLCDRTLGMTDPLPGVGVGAGPEPAQGWTSGLADAGGLHLGASGARGLLAARRRPPASPGLHQAALRRRHDVLCLSVLLAPDASDGSDGSGWPALDAAWDGLLREAAPVRPETGVVGTARLYLSRLTREAAGELCTAPDSALTAAVRRRLPVHTGARPGRPGEGVVVPQGFAVWEDSAAPDDRTERRLAVVAPHDRDPELTAWTWTTRTRGLPPLATYLLNAAKLRYQLRVWSAAEAIGRLRTTTDTTITALLEHTATAPRGAGRQQDLLRASHALVDLQARERGLVDRSTRSREMARTVEIAAANLTALSGDPALGGPFADDRELAQWLLQRLDDETAYLEAALRRSEQVGVLADQLLQRGLQRRQETINLGLTGAVGAVLMTLAAVQSLQYSVPLPGPVKPAVVTLLGAFALLASLLVLRVVTPERRWSLVLVRTGAGALGAALGWVVAATAFGGAAQGWTWICAGAGAAAGSAAAAVTARWRG